MATLEKIRSKSVLLLIVIGVALLAFIIGDFFNSSRTLFGPDQSIAKIDGDEIDPQEFQNRKQSRQTSGNSDEERAYDDQSLLMQIVMERLQDEEYDNLGLTVTDEELNAAVNGNDHAFADMLAFQYAGQYLGIQVPSASQLYDITNNPTKYGYSQENAAALKKLWLNFEEFLTKQLIDMKFSAMLEGTMAANKLDVAQMYEDSNTGYMISYVKKAYGVNPDIKVTDAEIQKAWETDKAQYQLDEETRLINLIAVPIVPSVEDEEAARTLMAEVVEGLSTTDGIEALRGRKGFEYRQLTLTNEAIAQAVKRGGNSNLQQFTDSAAIGSARIIEDGPTQFQIAKLLSRGNAVDSIMLNVVVFDASLPAVTDSIKSAIAAGKPAKEIQTIEGVGLAMDSIYTSITNPEIQIPQLSQQIASDFQANKNAFLESEIGQPFQADSLSATTSGYGMLYTVTDRKTPQNNVELVLVDYELKPSQTTIDNLRSNLEKYLTANNTAAKFVANAAAANYTNDYTDVSASAPYVQLYVNPQTGQRTFLPNSNKAALWALEATKGSVSPVFGDERTGAFLAAALVDIYTDYRTTTDPAVKNYFTQKIRNSKTGDTMVKEYTGKASDLEGFATVMGANVATDAVNFSTGARIYGPELLAKIATAPVGTLSAPEKAEDGVVVYQVNSISTPARPVDMNTDAAEYNYRRGMASLRNGNAFFKLFLGKRPYENRLYKVFKEQ